MSVYRYYQPESLEDALEYLKDNDGAKKPLAGGTDLLIRIRAGKECPSEIVSLELPELIGITEDANEIVIGAGTPLDEVSSRFLKAGGVMGMVGKAAESVGSWQTRCLATLAGNICTGNASSDMAVALIAAGAVIDVRSADGARSLPVEALFVTNRRLSITPEEIVTAVRFPIWKQARTGAEFIRVGKRRGHIIASLNVAAAVGTDADGRAERISLAAGTLAPTPIRLTACEELLAGNRISEDLLEEVKAVMLTEITPRDSMRASKAYREAVAPAMLARAIRTAAGMPDPEAEEPAPVRENRDS